MSSLGIPISASGSSATPTDLKHVLERIDLHLLAGFTELSRQGSKQVTVRKKEAADDSGGGGGLLPSILGSGLMSRIAPMMGGGGAMRLAAMSARFVPAAAGATAAGIGGKAAAGIGMGAALASNPVGWAIAIGAAVVGVTAALLTLPGAIKNTVKELIESQRQLAEVSASMAVIMADLDVKELMRQRRKGERLAPDVRQTAAAYNELAEQRMETEILWERFKLWWERQKTAFGSFLMNAIDPMAKQLNEITKNTDKTPLAPTTWDWMRAVAEDTERMRERNPEIFKPRNLRRPDEGLLGF